MGPKVHIQYTSTLRIVCRFKAGLVTRHHNSGRFQCFLCVQFHGDSSWSMDGVMNLVYLNDKIKIMGKSKEHIVAVPVKMATCSKVNFT